MKTLPNLSEEKKLWKKGFVVIGVDEVGRGAFAGPLMVGAVGFKKKLNSKEIERLESIGINDSKKLTPQKREILSKIIKKEALVLSTAKISVETINKVGIGKATQMAVRKVIKIIQSKVKDEHKLFVLMDAFYIRYLRGVGLRNQKAIVKGDEKSLSIAAASIVAKVKRDGLMEKLDRDYPVYNWKMNKGYGTLDHRTAIKKNGKTKHHRDAFVKNVV